MIPNPGDASVKRAVSEGATGYWGRAYPRPGWLPTGFSAVCAVYGHQLNSRGRMHALGVHWFDWASIFGEWCEPMNSAGDAAFCEAIASAKLFVAMANPVQAEAWSLAVQCCEAAKTAGALALLFVPDSYAGESCDNYLYCLDDPFIPACVMRYLHGAGDPPCLSEMTGGLFQILLPWSVVAGPSLWRSDGAGGWRPIAADSSFASKFQLILDLFRSGAVGFYAGAGPHGAGLRPLNWAVAAVMGDILDRNFIWNPPSYGRITGALLGVNHKKVGSKKEVWEAIEMFLRLLPAESDVIVHLEDCVHRGSPAEDFSAYVVMGS